MSGTAARSRLDERELRRRPALTVVPYVLLAVLVVVTIAADPAPGRSLLVDLSLCGLAAVWMLGMLTVHPAWRDRPRAMAVFFTVLLAIIAVLVVRRPWFGFFTPALYVYAFRLLPWPHRLVAVAAVAVVAGHAQAYAVDPGTVDGLVAYVAILVANVLPMCGFAFFARRSAEQEAERAQALHELGEANRKLEATLVANAALQEQLLAKAREDGIRDERERLARELHDTLAQGLVGIVTQLRAAEHAGAGGWRRHVVAATGLARESLSEARRSVHALRPEALRSVRLGEALAAVTERWSALHGIAAEVTTTGTPRPVRSEAEVVLLRAAQEALANVAKHAAATKVVVTLSYLEGEVAVDVRDNGRGFDPGLLPAPTGTDTPADGSGFGLLAMRQRIESLSGTLQVESEPGDGTGISASVPTGPADGRA